MPDAPAAAPAAPECRHRFASNVACLDCGKAWVTGHASALYREAAGTPPEREARASVRLDGETHAVKEKCRSCNGAGRREVQDEDRGEIYMVRCRSCGGSGRASSAEGER